MTMNITSSAFDHNGSIPRVHTCEGKDISPPLSWSSAPAGTRSLVLIVDDPDAPEPAAPRMTWVHWVPVSYTHLDVYKRQVFTSAQAWASVLRFQFSFQSRSPHKSRPNPHPITGCWIKAHIDRGASADDTCSCRVEIPALVLQHCPSEFEKVRPAIYAVATDSVFRNT